MAGPGRRAGCAACTCGGAPLLLRRARAAMAPACARRCCAPRSTVFLNPQTRARWPNVGSRLPKPNVSKKMGEMNKKECRNSVGRHTRSSAGVPGPVLALFCLCFSHFVFCPPGASNADSPCKEHAHTSPSVHQWGERAACGAGAAARGGAWGLGGQQQAAVRP